MEAEKVRTIGTLTQFVEAINSLKISEGGVFPSLYELSFRGQSRSDFKLAPSLARRPSNICVNSWAMVEADLIRCAQQKFPALFPDSDPPVLLLAKLQHYGIHTRMLDVTANALVALYFACNKDEDCDGEVFAFQAAMCSAYDVKPNVIADTYRLIEGAFTLLETYWLRVLHRPYATRLLVPNWKERLSDLSKRYTEYVMRPIFVGVGNACERQRSQGGRFILFPNRTDNGKISSELVSIEKDDAFVIKRLIIQKEAKQAILSQLRRFGITEEFLFPDNVDKVLGATVEEIRQRHYTINLTN